MTKRLLFAKPDGSVGIVIPAPNSKLTILEHAALAVPAGVPYDIVDSVEIPTDRTFRNSWEVSNARVITDMPKAQLLAQEKIRQAREPVFKKLDTESLLELEGAVLPRPTGPRKTLARNSTQDARLSAARDPDALKLAMNSVISEVEGLVS